MSPQSCSPFLSGSGWFSNEEIDGIEDFGKGDIVVSVSGCKRTPSISLIRFTVDLGVAYEYGWIQGFNVVEFTSGNTKYGLEKRMIRLVEIYF